MKGKIDTRSLRFQNEVYSLILGDFSSFVRGSGGVEYSGIKPYEAGDQTKDINERVSEKLDDLYVNVRKPDRELEVVFILDTTRSMTFGSGDTTKLEFLIAVTKKLITILGEEKITYSIATQTVSGWSFELLGKTVSSALKEFEKKRDEFTGSSIYTFDPNATLEALYAYARRSTVYAILISDFIDVQPCGKMLSRLKGAKHKIIGLRILDPMEQVFPKFRFGAFRVRDLENGQSDFFTGLTDISGRHEDAFEAAGCGFFTLTSNQGGET